MTSIVKRKAYHVGNLEEQLINKAKIMLEEVGPNKLSIRAVAEQLGISATAVYYHFSNKDELLSQLAADGFKQLEHELKTSLIDVAFQQRLLKVSKAYLNFAVTHPAMYQLMFGSQLVDIDNNAHFFSARKKAYQVLENCIADVIGKDVESKEVRSAALAGWSYTHGLASLVIHDILTVPEQYTNDILVEKTLLGLEQLITAAAKITKN